jgi:pimeloyl-ACP methyl ester carboxylesterase
MTDAIAGPDTALLQFDPGRSSVGRRQFLSAAVLGGVLLTTGCGSAAQGSSDKTAVPAPADARPLAATRTGYAPVNGLRMYYEVYGTGRPVVLLHGAFTGIQGSFASMIPVLARTHQVVAIESQGHGRTADIPDRPLTYEQMADDTAAAIAHLGLRTPDIYGYSMGAGTGLQLAIRHPGSIRKMVLATAAFRNSGWHPELMAAERGMTGAALRETPFYKEYVSLAPDPSRWDSLTNKIKVLDTQRPQDWPEASIRGIRAPTLLICGDADAVRLEHTVELFRLFGGGVPGDLQPMPASQLAVLPGCNHLGIIERGAEIGRMASAFFDAAPPAQHSPA